MDIDRICEGFVIDDTRLAKDMLAACDGLEDLEDCMVAALQVVKRVMGEPSEGLSDNLAGAESSGDLGAPTPSHASMGEPVRSAGVTSKVGVAHPATMEGAADSKSIGVEGETAALSTAMGDVSDRKAENGLVATQIGNKTGLNTDQSPATISLVKKLVELLRGWDCVYTDKETPEEGLAEARVRLWMTTLKAFTEAQAWIERQEAKIDQIEEYQLKEIL